MPFRLDSWLAGQKIRLRFRQTNQAVAQYRVVNPYHAVSVHSGPDGCPAAARLQDERFLPTEAPNLPLAGCSSVTCSCVYQHHDDRRSGEDRRQKSVVVRRDRRRSPGRRQTDP